MSLNRAILIGRVGKDPDIRYSQSGTCIVSFSIATSETWKDKSGEKQEKTEWHKIVAFGKLGEIVGQYVTQGMLVFIGGKIQHREWEDEKGEKHKVTEIVANEMKMLGGGKKKDGGESADDRTPAQQMSDDSDVPF